MPAPQPPRILSFQQLCVEADPDYWFDLQHPVQYRFERNRKFLHNYPFYGTFTTSNMGMEMVPEIIRKARGEE